LNTGGKARAHYGEVLRQMPRKGKEAVVRKMAIHDGVKKYGRTGERVNILFRNANEARKRGNQKKAETPKKKVEGGERRVKSPDTARNVIGGRRKKNHAGAEQLGGGRVSLEKERDTRPRPEERKRGRFSSGGHTCERRDRRLNSENWLGVKRGGKLKKEKRGGGGKKNIDQKKTSPRRGKGKGGTKGGGKSPFLPRNSSFREKKEGFSFLVWRKGHSSFRKKLLSKGKPPPFSFVHQWRKKREVHLLMKGQGRLLEEASVRAEKAN